MLLAAQLNVVVLGCAVVVVGVAAGAAVVAATSGGTWWWRHGSCLLNLYQKVGATAPARAPFCKSSMIEWHQSRRMRHAARLYSPSDPKPVDVLTSSAYADSLATAKTRERKGSK